MEHREAGRCQRPVADEAVRGGRGRPPIRRAASGIAVVLRPPLVLAAVQAAAIDVVPTGHVIAAPGTAIGQLYFNPGCTSTFDNGLRGDVSGPRLELQVLICGTTLPLRPTMFF